MANGKIDETAAKAEIERLLKAQDENALIQELGIRRAAIKADPKRESELALRATYDAAAMGPLDGIIQLGRDVLVQWAKELQKLVCGEGAKDAADRKKLRDAFGVGKTTGALILTSGLIAIGCPVALAPVIAAIVMTRFVGSAADVFCKHSKKWVDELTA